MKKEVFLALVLANALTLKEKATAEEKANLNAQTIKANDPTTCLLAQLTGSSRSDRALELLNKTILASLPQEDINEFLEIEFEFIWSKVKLFKEKMLERISEVTPDATDKNILAPIETFLYFRNANVTELVEFLKGDRTEFVPSFND